MRPGSKWMVLGSVRVFDDVEPDKGQALKPLEEAAEVFGAWQAWKREHDECRAYGNESSGNGDEMGMRDVLIDECADLIQATCNLLASVGVADMREAMDLCEQRNRERGRITK